MAIVFDAALAAALARELGERLDGARLRAVRVDRPGRVLSLLFREGTLRFGLHPEAGTVAWDEPEEPGPHDRPIAAKVRTVESLADDRVLVLSLLRVRGSPPVVDVIVEWITKRWNAVVTEGPERTVRHVLIEMEGERAPRVGRPWTPPAPSTRAGIDGALALDRWLALLEPVAPAQRRRALLDGVAWTSALNVRALLGEGDADLAAGHALWRDVAAAASGRTALRPVLLASGGAAAPQPYPLPLAGTPSESVETLLDAFAAARVRVGAVAPRIPGALLDALSQRVVRAWARVESLGVELERAEDPEALRAVGNLLLARLHELPARGSARAVLTGFDGQAAAVDIDPQLAPHEQGPAYYERAARSERARGRLPKLIDAARTEARRLEALQGRAASGEAPVEDVQSEVSRGLPVDTSGAGPVAPALPYRVYTSSGGFEIRVGRGARHNDDLTFHHSSPEDVWLHAREAAGAHVVLRWKGEGSPPPRDLAEAAVLAALHSKARTSGTVPVDWTRRKYVRKPRKAPPGQVLVERAKTVFVRPDPAVEERLRAPE